MQPTYMVRDHEGAVIQTNTPCVRFAKAHRVNRSKLVVSAPNDRADYAGSGPPHAVMVVDATADGVWQTLRVLRRPNAQLLDVLDLKRGHSDSWIKKRQVALQRAWSDAGVVRLKDALMMKEDDA